MSDPRALVWGPDGNLIQREEWGDDGRNKSEEKSAYPGALTGAEVAGNAARDVRLDAVRVDARGAQGIGRKVGCQVGWCAKHTHQPME